MRKSILLFFFLLAAIVLWKITENSEGNQWNEASVEEQMIESDKDKIAIN